MSASRRRVWMMPLAFAGALALSAISLAYLRAVPFAWVFLGWALAAGCWAGVVRGKRLKRLSIVAAILFLGCALAELAVWGMAPAPAAVPEWTVQEIRGDGAAVDLVDRRGHFRIDDVLGYAAKPSTRLRMKKRVLDHTIYDAVYTVDADGLRESPEGSADEAVLFFGGSFVFGEGVADGETLPSRFAARASGLRAFNFGYFGYGPHQMLCMLESGRVRRIVGERKVRAAVYLAIPDHVRRIAGLSSWSKRQPRYELDGGAGVSRSGFFAARSWLDKSLVYSRFLGDHRPIRESDVDLFVEVVKESRATFFDQYPEARFVVLYWDTSGGTIPGLPERLREAGFKVHAISSILPAFAKRAHEYTIPYDGHPTPLCHERVAEHLAELLR